MKLTLEKLPVSVRIAAVVAAAPIFFAGMAGMTGLALMNSCGAVSSSSFFPEPSFYVAHQGEANPVWYKPLGTAPVSPVILPAALNNVVAGDIAVLRYPTSGDWLYMVASNLNALAIVDISTSTAKVIATVPVGQNPSGLAIDNSAAFAYVSITGASAVAVVDLSSYQLVATISLPSNSQPKGIAVTPDGNKVYVANSGLNTISVIDTTTRSVIGSISVGQLPTGMAIGPNGDDLYVANTTSGTINVIDTMTDTVSSTVTGLVNTQAIGVEGSGANFFVSQSVTSGSGSGPGAVTSYDASSIAASTGPYLTSSRASYILGLNADSFLSANFDANTVTERWVTPGDIPVLKNLTVGSKPVSLAIPKQVNREPVRPFQNVVNANQPFLEVKADGIAFIGSKTFTDWTANSTHQLEVNTPQADPNNGVERWGFSNWTGSANSSANPLNVTAMEQGGTYTANFIRQCKLTINTVGNGSVIANPASSDGYYNCGKAITLTATPATGNQFSSWSGDLTATTSPQLLSVNPSKTVTATFTAAGIDITIQTSPLPLSVQFNNSPAQTAPALAQFPAGSQISLTAPSPQLVQGTQYRFFSWSPGGQLTPTISLTTPNTAATYTATFQVDCYVLILGVTPQGGGSLTASPQAVNNCYAPGTQVTITGNGVNGNVVQSWNGTTSTNGNTATIAMLAPKTVTATFGAPSSVAHTITSNPVGFKVQVDGGVQQTAPATASWTAGSAHSLSAPSPQTNTAGNIQYSLTGWTGAAAVTSSGAVATAPATAATYTANFSVSGYTLTVGASPAGCATYKLTPPLPASGFYSPATSVTIEATATTGNTITLLSGTIPSVGQANAAFTMNQPQTVTISCVQNVQNTITTSPAGLQVTVDSTIQTAPATVSWAPATIHTLTVPSPQTNTAGDTRYTFSGWSPAVGASINAPSTPTTYTASFTTAYRVSLTVTGSCSFRSSAGSLPVFLNSGTAFNIDLGPNTGNILQSVTVNGVAQPKSPTGTASFSTNAITAPITIAATCVAGK